MLRRLAGFACGVLLATLAPGPSAAEDAELDDLRRQMQEMQRRIDQLDRERAQPATAPPTPPVEAAAADEGFESQDQSGNDPRAFSNKFMPYYRYTELETISKSTK